jgi:hypothetical protein
MTFGECATRTLHIRLTIPRAWRFAAAFGHSRTERATASARNRQTTAKHSAVRAHCDGVIATDRHYEGLSGTRASLDRT